ncbi:MAG: DUF2948 family protein [Amaricoccus sp.]|uniref:DUF2948 family protein n=1 Tax=Amaricoccus sp. TaxID=1872485 RepID=UPI0039E7096D
MSVPQDARPQGAPPQDARFEDGVERPLRLRAESVDDLAVVSALLQDAVAETGEIAWARRRRRFTLLLNRFRWEDAEAARLQGRPFERVRTLLVFDDVLAARSEGVDPADKATVLALLSVGFEPGEDGAGRVRLVFAGDGEIALDVECLDATLTDVTRPYEALSGHAPSHPGT